MQSKYVTVGNVRVYFDALIDKFPEMEFHLSVYQFYSSNFENSVGKLQLSLKDSLTGDEKVEVSTLMVGPILPEPNEDLNLSLAERALKRQKGSSVLETLESCDTRFILPTSNACEYHFSVVGRLLIDRN